MWKKIIILLCLSLTFLNISVTTSSAQLFVMENENVGQPVQDFLLDTTNSKDVNFNEFRNDNKAIIFFWATWCPHCRTALKDLNERKDDFEKSLSLLDEFYTLKFSFFKDMINEECKEELSIFEDEDELENIYRQFDLIDILSNSFHRKVELNLQNYTVENADKDSKLSARLTEFTLLVVIFTWVLIELEILSGELNFKEFFSMASMIWISVLVFYLLNRI